MDTRARFGQLYQQVGRVTLDADTPADELDRFHRAIARAYAANPDLRISGNRLAHAADPTRSWIEISAYVADRIADAVAAPATAADTIASPVIFRRETAFRSNLLGNSVPDWGARAWRPPSSFGPFLDEQRAPRSGSTSSIGSRLVSVSTWRVYRRRSSAPRVPIWGTADGPAVLSHRAGQRVDRRRTSIARTAALRGLLHGPHRSRAASLDLSLVGDRVSGSQHHHQCDGERGASPRTRPDRRPRTQCRLLEPIAVASAAGHLPKTPGTAVPDFNASSLAAGDASSTVFGCTTSTSGGPSRRQYGCRSSVRFWCPFSAATQYGRARSFRDRAHPKSALLYDWSGRARDRTRRRRGGSCRRRRSIR